jgi:hypothetical protein
MKHINVTVSGRVQGFILELPQRKKLMPWVSKALFKTSPMAVSILKLKLMKTRLSYF